MSSHEAAHSLFSDPGSEVPSSDRPLPSSPSPVKSSEVPARSTQQDGEHAIGTEQTASVEVSRLPNPRLAALATKQASLETRLADLQAQKAAMVQQTKLPSGPDVPADWSGDEKAKHALANAQSVIKDHIALLHSYNEMKDIGLGLMGLVAEKRGVRVASIMDEFDMSEKD